MGTVINMGEFARERRERAERVKKMHEMMHPAYPASDISVTIRPRNRTVARELRRAARRLEREPMATFHEEEK